MDLGKANSIIINLSLPNCYLPCKSRYTWIKTCDWWKETSHDSPTDVKSKRTAKQFMNFMKRKPLLALCSWVFVTLSIFYLFCLNLFTIPMYTFFTLWISYDGYFPSRVSGQKWVPVSYSTARTVHFLFRRKSSRNEVHLGGSLK